MHGETLQDRDSRRETETRFAASPPDGELLRLYLADRDVDCPRCGYNLRGSAGSACPECGDALRLQVGLVHPKLGPYLALVILSACAFGGSLLFGLIAWVNAPLSWWAGWSARALLAQLVLGAVALLATSLFARRIRRWGARRQWIAAMIVAALLIALSSIVVIAFNP